MRDLKNNKTAVPGIVPQEGVFVGSPGKTGNATVRARFLIFPVGFNHVPTKGGFHGGEFGLFYRSHFIQQNQQVSCHKQEVLFVLKIEVWSGGQKLIVPQQLLKKASFANSLLPRKNQGMFVTASRRVAESLCYDIQQILSTNPLEELIVVRFHGSQEHLYAVNPVPLPAQVP